MAPGDETREQGGRVRRAGGEDDFRSAGELLDRFNDEAGWPTPGPAFLTERVAELDGDDFAAFLACDQAGEGQGDAGIGVIRFRPAIWSARREGYIAELYVAPASRKQGLGTELMEAMVALARERDCEWIELGTDEGDHDAHRLYERFGFTVYANPDAPPGERERMFVYEREL